MQFCSHVADSVQTCDPQQDHDLVPQHFFECADSSRQGDLRGAASGVGTLFRCGRHGGHLFQVKIYATYDRIDRGILPTTHAESCRFMRRLYEEKADKLVPIDISSNPLARTFSQVMEALGAWFP